jgi:hypothetical protein
MRRNICFFCIMVLFACKVDSKIDSKITNSDFGQPVKVEMIGYNGHVMEPFISRDGRILLFNNLNSLPENTNLHWSVKVNDSVFQYKGEVTGVNTADLEGVPTMDNTGKLYFVSLQSYANTLSTLYQGDFLNGMTTNVELVKGVSRLQAGWVNFDIEVSADGGTIYFADALFGQTELPLSADLVVATKNSLGFQSLPNSKEIMKNINTTQLEYAACIAENQLELYFTRLNIPLNPALPPAIFVATRQNINEPFGEPSKIQSITGFVEAPTIAPNQKTLYYHAKENNKYRLYMVRKK